MYSTVDEILPLICIYQATGSQFGPQSLGIKCAGLTQERLLKGNVIRKAVLVWKIVKEREWRLWNSLVGTPSYSLQNVLRACNNMAYAIGHFRTGSHAL